MIPSLQDLRHWDSLGQYVVFYILFLLLPHGISKVLDKILWAGGGEPESLQVAAEACGNSAAHSFARFFLKKILKTSTSEECLVPNEIPEHGYDRGGLTVDDAIGEEATDVPRSAPVAVHQGRAFRTRETKMFVFTKNQCAGVLTLNRV